MLLILAKLQQIISLLICIEHQMYVVLFCQDSTLSFSNGKATFYLIEKKHMPTFTTVKG